MEPGGTAIDSDIRGAAPSRRLPRLRLGAPGDDDLPEPVDLLDADEARLAQEGRHAAAELLRDRAREGRSAGLRGEAEGGAGRRGEGRGEDAPLRTPGAA